MDDFDKIFDLDLSSVTTGSSRHAEPTNVGANAGGGGTLPATAAAAAAAPVASGDLMDSLDSLFDISTFPGATTATTTVHASHHGGAGVQAAAVPSVDVLSELDLLLHDVASPPAAAGHKAASTSPQPEPAASVSASAFNASGSSTVTATASSVVSLLPASSDAALVDATSASNTADVRLQAGATTEQPASTAALAAPGGGGAELLALPTAAPAQAASTTEEAPPASEPRLADQDTTTTPVPTSAVQADQTANHTILTSTVQATTPPPPQAGTAAATGAAAAAAAPGAVDVPAGKTPSAPSSLSGRLLTSAKTGSGGTPVAAVLTPPSLGGGAALVERARKAPPSAAPQPSFTRLREVDAAVTWSFTAMKELDDVCERVVNNTLNHQSTSHIIAMCSAAQCVPPSHRALVWYASLIQAAVATGVPDLLPWKPSLAETEVEAAAQQRSTLAAAIRGDLNTFAYTPARAAATTSSSVGRGDSDAMASPLADMDDAISAFCIVLSRRRLQYSNTLVQFFAPLVALTTSTGAPTVSDDGMSVHVSVRALLAAELAAVFDAYVCVLRPDLLPDARAPDAAAGSASPAAESSLPLASLLTRIGVTIHALVQYVRPQFSRALDTAAPGWYQPFGVETSRVAPAASPASSLSKGCIPSSWLRSAFTSCVGVQGTHPLLLLPLLDRIVLAAAVLRQTRLHTESSHGGAMGAPVSGGQVLGAIPGLALPLAVMMAALVLQEERALMDIVDVNGASGSAAYWMRGLFDKALPGALAFATLSEHAKEEASAYGAHLVCSDALGVAPWLARCHTLLSCIPATALDVASHVLLCAPAAQPCIPRSLMPTLHVTPDVLGVQLLYGWQAVRESGTTLNAAMLRQASKLAILPGILHQDVLASMAASTGTAALELSDPVRYYVIDARAAHHRRAGRIGTALHVAADNFPVPTSPAITLSPTTGQGDSFRVGGDAAESAESSARAEQAHDAAPADVAVRVTRTDAEEEAAFREVAAVDEHFAAMLEQYTGLCSDDALASLASLSREQPDLHFTVLGVGAAFMANVYDASVREASIQADHERVQRVVHALVRAGCAHVSVVYAGFMGLHTLLQAPAALPQLTHVLRASDAAPDTDVPDAKLELTVEGAAQPTRKTVVLGHVTRRCLACRYAKLVAPDAVGEDVHGAAHTKRGSTNSLAITSLDDGDGVNVAEALEAVGETVSRALAEGKQKVASAWTSLVHRRARADSKPSDAATGAHGDQDESAAPVAVTATEARISAARAASGTGSEAGSVEGGSDAGLLLQSTFSAISKHLKRREAAPAGAHAGSTMAGKAQVNGLGINTTSPPIAGGEPESPKVADKLAQVAATARDRVRQALSTPPPGAAAPPVHTFESFAVNAAAATRRLVSGDADDEDDAEHAVVSGRRADSAASLPSLSASTSGSANANASATAATAVAAEQPVVSAPEAQLADAVKASVAKGLQSLKGTFSSLTAPGAPSQPGVLTVGQAIRNAEVAAKKKAAEKRASLTAADADALATTAAVAGAASGSGAAAEPAGSTTATPAPAPVAASVGKPPLAGFAASLKSFVAKAEAAVTEKAAAILEAKVSSVSAPTSEGNGGATADGRRGSVVGSSDDDPDAQCANLMLIDSVVLSDIRNLQPGETLRWSSWHSLLSYFPCHKVKPSVGDEAERLLPRMLVLAGERLFITTQPANGSDIVIVKSNHHVGEFAKLTIAKKQRERLTLWRTVSTALAPSGVLKRSYVVDEPLAFQRDLQQTIGAVAGRTP